jgi:hypothetical protein
MAARTVGSIERENLPLGLVLEVEVGKAHGLWRPSR